MPRNNVYVPSTPSFQAAKIDREDRFRFSNLSALPPARKRKVFEQLKQNNSPVIGYVNDPFVQELRTMFDGEICIHKDELGIERA